MSNGYIYRRALRFADTDMAGVGHFAAVLTMVEEAWHEWLRSLAESVHPEFAPPGAEPVGWPVVSIATDFRHPIRFGETVTVMLAVERVGARSIRLRFILEGPDGEFATGSLAVVCSTQAATGDWHARPVPASLAAKLTAHR